MDFIEQYDIELEKEQYQAGELLRGCVTLQTIENLKVTSIMLFLSGKAHVEWRVTKGGERRTAKEDQIFIENKRVVWGKEDDQNSSIPVVSILPRGIHQLPFEFQLPITNLPCSFESRLGTIRYCLRVIVDIPYASPPQGLKYFTIIGPSIDCFDDQYSRPQFVTKNISRKKCLFCTSTQITVKACLERSAYCCGEKLKLKCEIQNGSDKDLILNGALIQIVHYQITKNDSVLCKDLSHQALECKTHSIIEARSSKCFTDLYHNLIIPSMPPTIERVCNLIQVNYVLRVMVSVSKSTEEIVLEFPVTITSVPYMTISNNKPNLHYRPACSYVEGGIYISPEFQLGQVYDGTDVDENLKDNDQIIDDVILYRPVYVCVTRNDDFSEDSLNGLTTKITDKLLNDEKPINLKNDNLNHDWKKKKDNQKCGSLIEIKEKDKILNFGKKKTQPVEL